MKIDSPVAVTSRCGADRSRVAMHWVISKIGCGEQIKFGKSTERNLRPMKLTEKNGEVEQLLAQVQKDEEFLQKLQKLQAGFEVELNDLVTRRTDEVGDRESSVIRLLAGVSPNEIGGNSSGDVVEQIQKLRSKIIPLTAACLRQKIAVGKARLAYSRAACQALGPKYRGMVQKIAQYAIALSAATGELEAWLFGLRQRGIEHSGFLRAMRCGNLGDVGDVNSIVAMFLRECFENDILSKDEIPCEVFQEFHELKPGPTRKVRMKTISAGPNGVVYPGQIVKSEFADYLEREGMASPVV